MVPACPSFVFTRITPLAPRDPYKAVAVASFMIEKLSMSSGCKRDRSAVLTSILSINIKGDLAYPNEVTPRTKKFESSTPGSPVR